MKDESNSLCEIKVSYSIKVKKVDRKKINQSRDCYNILKDIYNSETVEMREDFYIICVNRSNEMIGYHKISSGGVSGTVVDARIIFSIAINSMASGIFLSHNHPSGQLQPSEQDISLTEKIKQGAKLLDMQLLDHIIYTPEGYYSFADEGVL